MGSLGSQVPERRISSPSGSNLFNGIEGGLSCRSLCWSPTDIVCRPRSHTQPACSWPPTLSFRLGTIDANLRTRLPIKPSKTLILTFRHFLTGSFYGETRQER